MHTITEMGVIAFNAQAVRASVDLVGLATRRDLARPTPCADWTLHGLLRHMIAQHYGFAAASEGDPDLAHWMLRPLGPDPVAAYRAAAERVLDAFAADGALDREFPLPEISRDLMFPAGQAISFHLVDYVVHGWDVARTLGLAAGLDPALVEVALRVAQAVPGGAARLEPGAAFGPVVDWPDDAGDCGLDRLVAQLGRSPGWQPGVVCP